MSGYIDFGSGHPFTTHNKFLHAFASIGPYDSIDHPSQDKLVLLQKFLQGFTIARPVSILNLPDCVKRYAGFLLTEEEAGVVEYLTKRYKTIIGMDMSERANAGNGAPDLDGSGAVAAGVMAQMAALHPMLAEQVIAHLEELEKKRNATAYGYGYDLDEDDENQDKDRLTWLKSVKERPNIIEESGRATTLMRLYSWLRETYPDEKMIFFSSSLSFLDIMDEAFRRSGVQALRYDGTVPDRKRVATEGIFQTCDSSRPLLITITAGKSNAISCWHKLILLSRGRRT